LCGSPPPSPRESPRPGEAATESPRVSESGKTWLDGDQLLNLKKLRGAGGWRIQEFLEVIHDLSEPPSTTQTMKPKSTLCSFLLAAGTSLLAIPSASAAVVLSDVILIDFGKTTDTTTGNWNNVAKTTPSSATFALNEVLVANAIRFSDAATTGVTLTRTGANDVASAGIGAATVAANSGLSFTGTGTIPNSAQVDLMYVSANLVTLTLGGLNNSLTYNLEMLSMIATDRNERNINVNGTIVSVDPNEAPFVRAFNNIATNGSGQIVISFPNAGGSADIQHINALQLTAIPEPSAALLGGLGLLALLRRRR
jgi:hypothetical protein